MLERDARENGFDTDELITLLVKASFAHWKVLKETGQILPPEFRPELEKLIEYYIDFYKNGFDYLRSRNLDVSSLPQL